MCRRRSLAILLVATLIGFQTGRGMGADKKAVPPAAKDLVGVWIGFDRYEPTFTRLDLRADSTGICARVAPADTILHDRGVHVFRITKWTVKDWDIELEMVPVSNAYKVGYVKGRIGLAWLSLTIGGPENGGWIEEPLLSRESRIMASNEETKESIQKVEKR